MSLLLTLKEYLPVAWMIVKFEAVASVWHRVEQMVVVVTSQQAFTCSKLTMETQQRLKICSKLTIKTQEQHYLMSFWCLPS